MRPSVDNGLLTPPATELNAAIPTPRVAMQTNATGENGTEEMVLRHQLCLSFKTKTPTGDSVKHAIIKRDTHIRKHDSACTVYKYYCGKVGPKSSLAELLRYNY